MEDPPNELTLVTNSPAIAYEVIAEPMHVVVCPGELDQHMRMLAGRWTVEFLDELNFDTAFVSAAGVTLDAGLTTSRRPLADVVNAARAAPSAAVGLIDATKFGRASLVSIAPAQELDVIVTDDGLEDDVAREYRAAGVRLEIVNPRGELTMARPVTLFTGQWADLPLDELAAKCGEWGFDGLELACWGDHFDVAEAVARPRLRAGPARAARAPRPRRAGRSATTSSARRCATRSTSATRACCRREIWGDGDPGGRAAARRRAR